TADNLDLRNTVHAGAGIVTLQPATGGTAINLGGADASGILGLTDAELGRIAARVLRVGAGSAGNLTVSAAISRHGYASLTLQAGGTVTQAAPLAVANLAVRAGNPVTLAHAANDVETLAVNVTGSNPISRYTDADDLAVGSVDGVAGVNAGIVVLTTEA